MRRGATPRRRARERRRRAHRENIIRAACRRSSSVSASASSREGPISFRDFMEAALYDREEGYYARGARDRRGRRLRDVAARSRRRSPRCSRGGSSATRPAARRPARLRRGRRGDGRVPRGLRRGDPRGSIPRPPRAVRLTAVERSAAGRAATPARAFAAAPRVLASAEELARGLGPRLDLLERALRCAAGRARRGLERGPAGAARRRRGRGLRLGRGAGAAGAVGALESFGVRLAARPERRDRAGRRAAHRRLARALAAGCARHLRLRASARASSITRSRGRAGRSPSRRAAAAAAIRSSAPGERGSDGARQLGRPGARRRGRRASRRAASCARGATSRKPASSTSRRATPRSGASTGSSIRREWARSSRSSSQSAEDVGSRRELRRPFDSPVASDRMAAPLVSLPPDSRIRRARGGSAARDDHRRAGDPEPAAQPRQARAVRVRASSRRRPPSTRASRSATS